MANLKEETEDICNQLTKYFGAVASDELISVLWLITDINDAMHNDINPDFINSYIDQCKNRLDDLKKSLVK